MFKGRIAVMLAAILCLALISTVFFREYSDTYASSAASKYPTVIIDAGHGGFDGGAVASDGTVEKDINLNIALTAETFAF